MNIFDCLKAMLHHFDSKSMSQFQQRGKSKIKDFRRICTVRYATLCPMGKGKKNFKVLTSKGKKLNDKIKYNPCLM